MTKKEAAEKIIEHGGACTGVFCSDCPIHGADCDRDDYGANSLVYEDLAQAYLDSLEPAEPTEPQKPTTEETEHLSSGELKRRIEKRTTRNYGPQEVGAPFIPTEAELLNVYKTERELLQLELLWDIRELLKNSLDQSYCVEQAINNAGR